MSWVERGKEGKGHVAECVAKGVARGGVRKQRIHSGPAFQERNFGLRHDTGKKGMSLMIGPDEDAANGGQVSWRENRSGGVRTPNMGVGKSDGEKLTFLAAQLPYKGPLGVGERGKGIIFRRR